MREKFLPLSAELEGYVIDHGARQDAVLAAVERETAALGGIAVMQIAPDQGAFLTLLVRLLGATRALEIGSFTGYSAICIARGLPADGSLLCLELSEDFAATTRANLRRAGLEDRADVRVGPALESLRALPREPTFDFAFVDADKPGYGDYYEETLARLRPGGLIVLDNMLFDGQVLDPAPGESAAAIDRVNAAIAADERVDCALLMFADGVMLARKR